MNAPLRLFADPLPSAGQSLYGRLVAHTTADYEQRVKALHQHPQLINRFDDALKPFVLTPHVKVAADGSIVLSATSWRGDDAQALLASMRSKGFQIGEPVKSPYQFTDGFVIWTAPVRGAGLEFSLLFYTPAETV